MLANRSLPERPGSRPTPERLVPAERDRGGGALGKAAVDSHSGHSPLGSGLSLPGGHPAAVCGIPGAHCEIAMLRPPDGGSRLELASFVTPDHVPGSPTAM